MAENKQAWGIKIPQYIKTKLIYCGILTIILQSINELAVK